MRGIYSLDTLNDGSSAPLLRKILSTFMLISASMLILMNFVQAIVFHRLVDRSIATQLLLIVFSGNILLLASCGLLLWYLLKRSFLPLSALMSWVATADELTEIECPAGVSQEIRDIFSVMNNATRGLISARHQLVQAERDSAIARTTQMLAHDVRKPFTMLRMTLDAMDSIESLDEFRTFQREWIGDVESAIESVNGLITDVMQIGSDTKPNCEPADLEALIDQWH
jgi:signal transduction histidine kinase